MNSKQAKSKLAEVSRSTGTKHVKILVADLCSVMKFVLSEIERIGTPVTAVLESRPDPIIQADRPRTDRPPTHFNQYRKEWFEHRRRCREKSSGI
jgi:hypothetical protein